ncbi:hypothetical protein KKE14_02880 [Patescibacteria group bacterium]|nr:hypothetical protein [Patescibacteria group bacterium]
MENNENITKKIETLMQQVIQNGQTTQNTSNNIVMLRAYQQAVDQAKKDLANRTPEDQVLFNLKAALNKMKRDIESNQTKRKEDAQQQLSRLDIEEA